MSLQVQEQTEKKLTPQSKSEVVGAEPTRPGPLFAPDVDIYETDAAITVLADMPGVRSENLQIDLRDNVLSIDGRPAPGAETNERTLLREFEIGAFHREFRLTNLIDQAGIDAKLANGVLELTLPKADAARPRKVQVRAG